MTQVYNIKQKNSKFVVTKNGEPFVPNRTDGAAVITEFDSKADAEKYLEILKKLKKFN